MRYPDIVYTVRNTPENNSEELRYSLRSLRNLGHQNVFVVGEKPDWLMNVIFIPVAQDRTKRENVMNNITAAVNNHQVSDDFILMNDDFFIMKEMQALPNLHFGPMADLIESYENRYPEGSDYIDLMKKQYELLLEQGIKVPISYELHSPMMFNKYKMVDMLNTKGPQYQMRSHYGNIYHIGGEQAEDVKLFMEPRHNPSEYNEAPLEYMNKQLFLSATGGSFNRGLPGRYIRAVFPQKSIYEL